jgi:molybdate-binding protein/transcriptional regulator with XRE-family HTH domain
MSTDISSAHPVTLRRFSRGWSQADLEARSGVPRSTISAIESRRLSPSVTAALAISRALGGSVESLFGGGQTGQGGIEWAWEPRTSPCRYWEALVGYRHLAFPVESLATNSFAHDGVWRDGGFHSGTAIPAAETLVLACCDPAAGLLAAEFARATGFRLLVLDRGGLSALELLKSGLVHLAGLHFATDADPERNAAIARRELGGGHTLIRAAGWQEGVAVAVSDRFRSLDSLAGGCDSWALREPGSAARECLDGLIGQDRAPAGRIVGGHAGVASAVRAGWAEAGVCVRLSAEEAGLAFLPVREESLDFCVAESQLTDPRVRGLIRVLQSRAHRSLLDELPGYQSRQTGEMLSL